MGDQPFFFLQVFVVQVFVVRACDVIPVAPQQGKRAGQHAIRQSDGQALLCR